MTLIESPKVGILCSSLSNKPWGGLEYQVFHLVKHLDINPIFFFENEPTPSLRSYEYRVFLPQNLEKTVFDIKTAIIKDNIRAFLLFSSWDVSDWVEVFKRVPEAKLLYSERSCPELVISRWDKDKRMELLERANKLHFFYDEYSKSEDKEIKNKSFHCENIPFKFGGSLNRKFRYLYCGAINKSPKRTHFLLPFFEENKNSYLTIISNRCEDKELLERFEKLENVDVRVKPITFNEELEELYRSSDALLFPSEYEGCSNSVLEANCFNLPVICFKSCLGASLAAKNHFFIDGPSEDEYDFKEAIEIFEINHNFEYNCNYNRIIKLWNNKIKELINCSIDMV